MPDFERLYYHLFATIADAVELLERGSFDKAKQSLISAMQDAEERFLQESE